MNKDAQQVVQYIHQFCEKEGIALAKFVKVTGVSSSTLSQWAYGKTRVTLEMRDRMVRAYPDLGPDLVTGPDGVVLRKARAETPQEGSPHFGAVIRLLNILKNDPEVVDLLIDVSDWATLHNTHVGNILRGLRE